MPITSNIHDIYWQLRFIRDLLWGLCNVVLNCNIDFFLHENDVRFVFIPSCLYEVSSLIYVICVCLCIVVSNMYWLYEQNGGCLREHISSPYFFVESVLLIFLVFCCVLLFVFVLCLVCIMLPVSLDCPLLIAPWIWLSNIDLIGCWPTIKAVQ